MPLPLPIRTDTVPSALVGDGEVEPAVAIEVARHEGDRPIVRPRTARAVWKVPSPLPRNTETVSENELATTRSALPSPLKSPLINAGPFPDGL